MQIAPIPPDEQNRINNLLSYEILDTPPEKKFDDLAELIAEVCNCRYALISFIDSDRQWFKATKEIPVKETKRDISFCAHTILQDDLMVIKDTRKDIRFYDNPLVTQDYQFSFYAGAAIVSAAGYKLGTVCAMDKKAKTFFTPKQKSTLKIVANQVSALLELGIKNKLLQKHTDSLLAAEKQIVQQTITEQEEEKNFIANELHENFAQTLAATKLYLDFAEQSKEMSSLFIQKSKANILQIIHDIKALSKSILPTTFENPSYLQFIEEMLQQYGKQNDKEIRFIHQGKLDTYDANIGLTLFRVIQYQLKNAHNCGAKKISITLKTDNNITLLLQDDGNVANALEPERKALLRHIETRLSLVNGKARLGRNKKGINQIEIKIPLTGL